MMGRKKNILYISIAVFGFQTTACAPDNELLCNAAQEKINEKYAECLPNATAQDLDCETFADTSLDCSDHFAGIEESLKCEEKSIRFDFGEACR